MAPVETSQYTEPALQLAGACAKEQKFAQAIVYLKDFLAHHPQHEVAAGMLAAIYAEIGLSTRAVHYYNKVLAINPNNPLARAQLQLLSGRAGERP